MKQALATVFVFLISMGLASSGLTANLGRQTQFLSDSQGPRMTVIHADDEDKIWVMTFSLQGRDLLPEQKMATLSWRLFDSKSDQYLGVWQTAVDHPAPVTYPGSLAFTWELPQTKVIPEAIQALPNLKLVFSVDQDLSAPVPTHFVDLGSYCKSHPEKFVNLTADTTGCDERK